MYKRQCIFQYVLFVTYDIEIKQLFLAMGGNTFIFSLSQNTFVRMTLNCVWEAEAY